MAAIITLLASNRVKSLLLAIVLAYLQQHYPQYAPSVESLEWIYGLIFAFIAGDTVRPIDPSKRPTPVLGDQAVRDAIFKWLQQIKDESVIAPKTGQAGP